MITHIIISIMRVGDFVMNALGFTGIVNYSQTIQDTLIAAETFLSTWLGYVFYFLPKEPLLALVGVSFGCLAFRVVCSIIHLVWF